MIDWNQVLDMRRAREEMGMTQGELADLLGVSIRVVQSCEQGWRHPSANVERHLLLLLLTHRLGDQFGQQKCWATNDCPPERCAACIVGRSRQGHVCWLLSGNLCGGKRVSTWAKKKAVCGECRFMHHLLNG